MRIPATLIAAAGVTLFLAAAACGPLRIDSAPHVRGTIVTSDADGLVVRHRNGREYRFGLSPDTRFTTRGTPTDAAAACPGARVVVVTGQAASGVASEVRVDRGCSGSKPGA